MVSGFATCPGLFYATPAEDGILSRMRIPGGMINSEQCRAIAEIAELHGGGYVDVTNRANLQIREIRTLIDSKVLNRLQNIGLGCCNTDVDQIRNIMTSPTAGIDSQELIDTRPFVQAWDNYLATHPALSALSAKFSVCFDGGGIVQVCDRLNDILFAAVLVDGDVYFRLHLSVGAKGQPPSDTKILLLPNDCLPILAALADVYLNHSDINNQRRLRLRDLLNTLGCENYLQQVQQRLTFPLNRSETCPTAQRIDTKYQHIGIHPQRQKGLFYIGVVLPLGRIESRQMQGLADLAAKYGSEIRLTPWQNLLLTDIPQQKLIDVQNEITILGLNTSATNIKSGLVACSGNKGCAASATDTKSHALALAKYLESLTLEHPINIHFTGCQKSCAQHSQSDITLLGVNFEVDNQTVEAYHVYLSDSNSSYKFGRQLYQYVTFPELPALIEKIIKMYKI
ncbi:precorrin-3B synthase [Nostoc sp. PA-18-2419]|uniref:precorrin-3B synthase n=1 Tax=Nostoc sp. PA-18-2419 TaxID=2575443 RepID=UPI001CB9C698|nr:precorrin-3B synthase [Nostoc sp. PA-18-2419]